MGKKNKKNKRTLLLSVFIPALFKGVFIAFIGLFLSMALIKSYRVFIFYLSINLEYKQTSLIRVINGINFFQQFNASIKKEKLSTYFIGSEFVDVTMRSEITTLSFFDSEAVIVKAINFIDIIPTNSAVHRRGCSYPTTAIFSYRPGAGWIFEKQEFIKSDFITKECEDVLLEYEIIKGLSSKGWYEEDLNEEGF